MATDDIHSQALTLVEEQADASIRRVWHDQRWYFSIIDVIGLLTDSPKPSQYWYNLRQRMSEEGYRELSPNWLRLRMRAADGKLRETDAADTETLLRIIQSIPSPKAEPIKLWLAKVGAKRLEQETRPLDAAQVRAETATITMPAAEAPALAWAEYYEGLAALYRRQAAYEARLATIDARLDEHEDEIGELHSRLEGMEEVTRLVPEILERLGPQTLTPEHRATAQAMVQRLHDLSGASYGVIYNELRQAFHVGKYDEIPEARWPEAAAWFQVRIDAALRRKR
jgi:hypothetical protein